MAGDIGTAKKSVLNIFENMEYGKKKNDITLAREWLNSHKKIDCWINGKFLKQKSLQYEFIKAADGTSLAEVADGFPLIDSAVESSLKAQVKWEATSPQEKSNVLYKISKYLPSTAQLFQQLNSVGYQKNDFSLFINYFNYYSDWALLLDDNKGWKALGVVLVVLSRDSPLHALAMTIAPALAAGCSVIVKPSRKSPFCAFLLAEICTNLGLPDGVLNIVPGSKKVTQGILSKKINKIVLSGNHLVAANLRHKDTSKSFIFLSSGQTTAIILESCDLNSATDKIFSETWNGSSYSPWSVSTVIVQESISPNFLNKLKRKIKEFSQESDVPLIFKNKKIAVKINKIVENAKNLGISVETSIISDEIWSPTALIEHQSQNLEPGLPVLTVLICRTAKEAANIANHSQYALATSIWTEISSQALEIASTLKSSTIWINCHGICDVDVPIQPLYASGDGVFGGRDGVLEYLKKSEEITENTAKHVEEKSASLNKPQILKITQTAQAAFNKWRLEKNRKKILNDLAEHLSTEKDLSQYSQSISYWAAYSGKSTSIAEQNTRQEFLVMALKEPIGTIAIFLNDSSDAIKSLFSLVPAALALGNAVILVTLEENSNFLKPALQIFAKYLPSGILTVLCGWKNEALLASDPNINSIWVCNDSTLQADYLQSIKWLSAKHYKHLWLTSNLASNSKELFAKECLKNKVIWLPKVHQFP